VRIGVISSQVFKVPIYKYGGLEAIAWQTARGLAKMDHQVALFAPDGSIGDGFDVIHTGPPGTFNESQAYNQYWKHLNNFHVLIDHSWQKNSYSLKQEGVLKIPILSVWHAPADAMGKPPPDIEKPCVVLISDDHRQHYEALFGRPGRTCYNGIDLDFYKPIAAEREARALFLARFSQIKGADLAIHACTQLNYPLDLVGDTTITNEPDYFRHCQSFCDGEKIRMVGPDTRGGCVLRYSKANFFLHPNARFREPFGLAPIEAQACGLPVATFNYGAMRETVKHGETGYLAGSLDEFVQSVQLLSTPGGIDDTVRKRCREWASQWTLERTCKRYAELCEEAVSTGGW